MNIHERLFGTEEQSRYTMPAMCEMGGTWVDITELPMETQIAIREMLLSLKRVHELEPLAMEIVVKYLAAILRVHEWEAAE